MSNLNLIYPNSREQMKTIDEDRLECYRNGTLPGLAITPAELRIKREPFPWDDQFIEKLRELENNEDDR